ncbi:MAG: hypothetical protein GY861_09110 [bacterium]|nr:hypothetical protein [bacterium]
MAKKKKENILPDGLDEELDLFASLGKYHKKDIKSTILNDTPSTGVMLPSQLGFLRALVKTTIERKGLNANYETVVSELDRCINEEDMSALSGLETWNDQRPALEDLLFKATLSVVVPSVMPEVIEKEKKNKISYRLATEGKVGIPNAHKLRNAGFVKEGPFDMGVYGYHELCEGRKDIFLLDEILENDAQLRDVYAPRSKIKDRVEISKLLTTVHTLEVVTPSGNHVNDTTKVHCRTKSGIGYLFKLVEYLTDVRSDGEERESIEDYLAVLSREPEDSETGINRWLKTIDIIEGFIANPGQDLTDAKLTLKGYTEKDVKKIIGELRKYPEYKGFIDRNDFTIEYKDSKTRFGELFIPVPSVDPATGQIVKNFVSYQIYTEDDYTKIEGESEINHPSYRAKKEKEMINNFTYWHWELAKRLAPTFVDEYMMPAFEAIYKRGIANLEKK